MAERPTVFLFIGASVLHTGHFNIVAKAARLGRLVVGLLADGVPDGVGKVASVSVDERMAVMSMVSCVDEIVVVHDAEGISYVRDSFPDVVVHGDNWRIGPLARYRATMLEVLGAYGGRLVEYPYSKNLYSSQLEFDSRKVASMPERRRPLLRSLLSTLDRPVRVMEAHNGLTGLIVENASVDVDGESRSYDAIWVSSLTDSTAKGKPDTELVDMTSRIETVEQIMSVTTKPIILDGDSGGAIEHFQYLVATLERIGVSAVIIEDKVGVKRNSLFGAAGGQAQDDVRHFCDKIVAGKSVLETSEFMIIARIESLILGAGMGDALARARAYVRAGADGIMIHSRCDDASEVREFCRAFRREFPDVVVVVVPTTYDDVTEGELGDLGADVVIYANHLLRAAYPAMMGVAQDILRAGRASAVRDRCLSIDEILALIPASMM